MTEEQNNGIPLPTDADMKQIDGRLLDDDFRTFMLQDEWQQMDTKPYELNFSEAYKPPRFTLSWNGVPFAPLGGIHNITGQAGNGKTMTIAQFMSAILCGEFGGLRYELSEEIPNPSVLYIDTEMEKDNTIAVKNRVLSMAGRNVNQTYDDFKIIMLRDVADIPQVDDKGNPVLDKKGRQQMLNPAIVRWRMILKAIWQYRPTVVFIDGLLDVVADFNDNIECQLLIFKCMKLASHYDTSLWCILHQNPGGEKLVGHLGSFLERKVTDVIQTKKIKDDKTGDVTFEVKQKKARSQDFADWSFRVLPIDSWGRPEQLEKVVEIKKEFKHTAEEIKAWLEDYQDKVDWPATLTDVRMKIFKEMCGFKSSDDLQQCVKIATNRTFLIPQPEHEFEEGQKKPKYYLNPEVMNIKTPY